MDMYKFCIPLDGPRIATSPASFPPWVVTSLQNPSRELSSRPSNCFQVTDIRSMAPTCHFLMFWPSGETVAALDGVLGTLAGVQPACLRRPSHCHTDTLYPTKCRGIYGQTASWNPSLHVPDVGCTRGLVVIRVGHSPTSSWPQQPSPESARSVYRCLPRATATDQSV